MNVYVLLFAIACCSGVSTVALEPAYSNINRIANGILASPQQFPYVVSIQDTNLSSNATRGHLCGGVLVTLHNVLTTASCLYQESNALLPINRFRVLAGSILLTNDTMANTRAVQNISIHPQYTGPPSYAFDVAVLGLVSSFSNVFRPIALPSATYRPEDFEECQTAGWGGDNLNTTISVNLRYANKYIYNQMLCTLRYNLEAGTPNVLTNVICATSYDMISTSCQNDRGNPLVCNGVLAGVLSYTGHCQYSNRPELFTRVSNFTTWIRSVSGASTTVPTTFVVMLAALHLVLNNMSH